MAATTWQKRVDSADWDAVTAEVNDLGCALLPRLLTPTEAAADRGPCTTRVEHFRATIDMARHRFGEGQYRYFDRPFPEPVEHCRQALYPRLSGDSPRLVGKLGREAGVAGHARRMARDVPPRRPAPPDSRSSCRYGPGDWNALHRDLYGDKVFPLQVVINLNEPGVDHTGGEFLLVEQRPRAQSRGTATLVPQGHGLVFTTRDRPVRSTRGWSAAPVRHGVSAIRTGQRHTLGLVFHDAA